MKPARVAVLQFAPTFGRADENLDVVSEALRAFLASGSPPPRLWVLPELALTGYQFRDRGELEQLAEPVDGPSASRLVRLAEETGSHIVTGFAELAGPGRVYNSALLVGPEGLVGVYRKVHLFGREKELFHPGDLGFPTFDLPLGRLGMMVCFDWLFPEAARSLALGGAQLVAHPANLVLPYCQEALVTRCIENRIFVAMANRTGREARVADEVLQFTGRSRIVSPDGQVLAEGPGPDGTAHDEAVWRPPKGSVAARAEVAVLHRDLDLDSALDKRITPFNDVLADRRLDQYRLAEAERPGSKRPG